MFANLQNKINLKKLNEDSIQVDSNLVYQKGFDVINNTIDYFMEEKDIINNIIIKEEIIEYDNEELISFLEENVRDEQKFIYNNDITLNHLREEYDEDEEEPVASEELESELDVLDDEDADIMQFINTDDEVINEAKSIREEELIVGGLADGMSIDDIAEKHGVDISQITSQVEKGIEIEMEHVNDTARAKEIALDHLFEFPDYYDRLEKMEDEAKFFHENYNKYHKVKGILPTLLEEKNKEAFTELDKYRMVSHDLEDSEEYDVKDLFDNEVIDIARSEHLEHIATVNWLEKQLNDYRKKMKEEHSSMYTIENNLKKLDVNNTEELKTKIKDVNGTIKLLEAKKKLLEKNNVGV